MSNACETCGYRSSDIKAGGGVSEKGSNITLNVSEQDDLRRDVIKAESASISIPEADLEVTTGESYYTLARQVHNKPSEMPYLYRCTGCLSILQVALCSRFAQDDCNTSIM